MENSKLRRSHLLKEKYRLRTLKVYYKEDTTNDLIIDKMLKNIDDELHLLDEQRERKKKGLQ